MNVTAVLVACLAWAPVAARAQAQEGADVFRARCASCHNGQPDSRAPDLDALRSRAPQAVIDALVNGAMRAQGSHMGGAERRAVAEYVTAKMIDGDVIGAATGRCRTTSPLANPARGPRWAGWSPAPTNTRFETNDQAGPTAGDLTRLTLKWAFGFPDAVSAWAQPTVAAGRVFVGSQNGTVYSLDAASGCIHWTHNAGGGVRTAIAVGPHGTRTAACFGDDHPLARITRSPTLYEGRLYVPVSSYEESQGADPQYGCCAFRGNLVALDAMTGAVVERDGMQQRPVRGADSHSPRRLLGSQRRRASGVFDEGCVDRVGVRFESRVRDRERRARARRVDDRARAGDCRRNDLCELRLRRIWRPDRQRVVSVWSSVVSGFSQTNEGTS